jgi:hypothetical protein
MCLYFQDRGHPLVFNPDVASPKILDYKYFPNEYKEFVINKLSKNLSLVKDKRSLKDIIRIIEVLKIQKDPEEVRHNVKNFVKYNDFMDRFRKTDSWRDLMPELSKILNKVINL